MRLTEHSYVDLVDAVHQNERCAQCGACIAICPFSAVKSKDFATKEQLQSGKRFDLPQSFQIYLPEKCNNCGLCFKSCPILNWDINTAEKELFDKASSDVLGNYIEIWQARSNNKQVFYNSQTGGASTALLSYAFDNKIIEVAIVAENNNWFAKPSLAERKEDLEKSQKTKYTQAHMLEVFDSYSQDLLNKKFTGIFTPCQIHGIHTLRNTNRGRMLLENNVILLGTFCYGTYDMESLIGHIQEQGVKKEDIIKIEIDQQNLRVFTEEGLAIDTSRNSIFPFLMNSCKFCHDFTNAATDISLGNIGSDDDYTTVIIRTNKGKEFFDEALKQGYVSANKLSSYNIEEIKKLSTDKIEYGVHEIFEQKTEFSQSLFSKTVNVLKNMFRSEKKEDFQLNSKIHSIYLINDAGLPIYSFPQEEKESALISGVFAALNLLVNSMSRGTQFLQEISYSDMHVLLENREGIIVAILVKERSDWLRDRISKFANEIAKKTILFEKGRLSELPTDTNIEKLVKEYFREE